MSPADQTPSTETVRNSPHRWVTEPSRQGAARLTASGSYGPSQLALRDAGHGYDEFGLNARWVHGALRATRWLYERYFRVTSHGASVLNDVGGAIIAANHSGTIPFDGAMLWHDVIRQTQPARVPRPIADFFVPNLPFVNLLFARVGVTAGSRGNTRRLLEQGELVMVFPEGTPGISKPFGQRYQLQRWRYGHAELAIRHRVPVVPVAIIGAEEQMPQLARIPFGLFGVPHLPLPASPLPLPVHYHIWYGSPVDLPGRFPVETADDPTAVAEAADLVRDAVAALIRRGCDAREGVFR